MAHCNLDHPALGLPANKVELRNHDPRWSRLYLTEARMIKRAFRGELVDIQHVGSTAVVGIKAKPIIDILAGIPSMLSADFMVEAFQRIGYADLGDKHVTGHRVFAKGFPRSYLVHVVEHGGAAWTRLLTFRDRLNSDPLLAQQYEALKVQLRERFQGDRKSYADAKTAFIDAAIFEIRR